MTWCATSCVRASPRCSASMPPNSNRTIRRRKQLPVKVTRSVVLGCGSYLPSRILTNAELSRKVDTSDEWIVQRTGIRERRIAAPGERTSDLALAAARAALEAGGVDPQSIDLQAVCSGFVFALAAADGLLKNGGFKRALVIGAETFSRLIDWSDRSTCVLFGDGAGAVVLDAVPQAGAAADRGILTAHLRSDGRYKDKLFVDGGPSSTGTTGYLRMEGREVFKYAVAMITDVVVDAFAATGYTAADVDWFVPHQANKRIIEGSAQKLGIAPEKVVITVDRHGNTSAASIPLALSTAVDDGRLKSGDLVLLEAMGGGFTWGAVLLRW